MGLVGRTNIILAGGVAVCALCAATPSHAQEANGAASGQPTLLQRLILGFGRPKVATDTPTAVTVLEDEQIEEEIPDTVSDLVEKIPGVNATGGDTAIGQNFNIRGFGPQEIGSNNEGRVQVNVDGATKYYESYRMGGVFTDPELYKRVEVLRGPAAGTLYGSGVLGGVINFTTKDASDFLEDGESGALRLKMTGDSNQEGYKASAILAARMGAAAEFLAAGSYTDFQNIVTGNGGELPGTGTQAPSGLFKGTFYLDDAHERVLRASYSHMASDGLSTPAPGGAPFGGDPYSAVPIPRTVDDTTAIISYEDAASDNPWLDLKINASYSKQRNSQEVTLNADMSYAYWELKAENTAEWTGDGYENYLTYGLQSKYHQRRRIDLDGTSASSHPDGDETVVGMFAQNEFIWNDRFTVITGLRGDWHQLTPVGTTLYQSDTTTPRPVQPTDVTGFAVSPKIALHYKLTDNLSVFGSYAYTERLPGVDEEFSWNATTVQGNLDKERANSVELGFGQDFDGVVTGNDTLSYKVTAFYNDIHDMMVRGTDYGGTEPYVNAGHVRIYGVEFESNYESDRFFASLGASAIRGDDLILDQPAPNIAPDEIFFTIGGKLPEHRIRFGWDARLVAAQDRVVIVPFPATPTEAFHVHDIFASWKPEEGRLAGFELTGRVDNLFNRQYQEFLQASAPAKGRTFKVSLAKTFKF
ncbi:MAG: TonB-dependent receptor [Oricola sp.]